MKKKYNIIYFNKISLNIVNYKLLEKNFNIIKIDDIKGLLKIKNPENIFAIYCDQRFFFSKKKLGRFKNLKFLVSSTTSTQFIDKEYSNKMNIKIISLEKEQKFLKQITPTAEHALGLLISLSRNYISSIDHVNKGNFDRRPFGGFKMLSKSSLGIIGYGRLGKIMKNISHKIFKKVKAIDIKNYDRKTFNRKLKKIFENSDFISLHIPSFKNKKFISKNTLGEIKNKFFLINTSRGDVVDEKFILKLLNKGKILGYATDVLNNEFSESFKLRNNPIYRHRNKYNILITPHIGGSTKDAWMMTENRVIKAFLKHSKL